MNTEPVKTKMLTRVKKDKNNFSKIENVEAEIEK